MSRLYPNPWDFSNTDKGLESPDGRYRIEFKNIHEIAMSAPLSGACYLIIGEDDRIKLSDDCGGPVVWNQNGRQVALPMWTARRKQKISIVDTDKMTLTTYRKEFRVLHLTSFMDNWLKGVDSPVHETEEINFCLADEKIAMIRPLFFM